MRFSARTSPPPGQALKQRGWGGSNGVTGEQGMGDAWDEENVEELFWEDVRPARGRERRRDGGGAAVAARLANPLPP